MLRGLEVRVTSDKREFVWIAHLLLGDIMSTQKQNENNSLIMVDYAANDPRNFKAWLRARAQGTVHSEFDSYLASLNKSGDAAALASSAARQENTSRQRSLPKFRWSTVVGVALGLSAAAVIFPWVV